MIVVANIIPDTDDQGPRMCTLYRGQKELSAVGCADAADCAKQLAVMVLMLDGGLRPGDVIQITRM